jgi:hypothetical protein
VGKREDKNNSRKEREGMNLEIFFSVAKIVSIFFDLSFRNEFLSYKLLI